MRLVDHFTVHLTECQLVIDRIDGACRGCVETHCDEVELICAKIGRKIDDFLILKLSYCYNLLARFGVGFPTDRELQETAATGGRQLPAVTVEPGAIHATPLPEIEPAGELLPEPLPPSEAYGQPDTLPDMSGLASSELMLPVDTPQPPTRPPAVAGPGCVELDLCRPGWLWWAAQWWRYWFWSFFPAWWRYHASWWGKPGDAGFVAGRRAFGRLEDGETDLPGALLVEPDFPIEEVSE